MTETKERRSTKNAQLMTKVMLKITQYCDFGDENKVRTYLERIKPDPRAVNHFKKQISVDLTNNIIQKFPDLAEFVFKLLGKSESANSGEANEKSKNMENSNAHCCTEDEVVVKKDDVESSNLQSISRQAKKRKSDLDEENLIEKPIERKKSFKSRDSSCATYNDILWGCASTPIAAQCNHALEKEELASTRRSTSRNLDGKKHTDSYFNRLIAKKPSTQQSRSKCNDGGGGDRSSEAAKCSSTQQDITTSHKTNQSSSQIRTGTLINAFEEALQKTENSVTKKPPAKITISRSKYEQITFHVQQPDEVKDCKDAIHAITSETIKRPVKENPQKRLTMRNKNKGNVARSKTSTTHEASEGSRESRVGRCTQVEENSLKKCIGTYIDDGSVSETELFDALVQANVDDIRTFQQNNTQRSQWMEQVWKEVVKRTFTKPRKLGKTWRESYDLLLNSSKDVSQDQEVIVPSKRERISRVTDNSKRIKIRWEPPKRTVVPKKEIAPMMKKAIQTYNKLKKSGRIPF